MPYISSDVATHMFSIFCLVTLKEIVYVKVDLLSIAIYIKLLAISTTEPQYVHTLLDW